MGHACFTKIIKFEKNLDGATKIPHFNGKDVTFSSSAGLATLSRPIAACFKQKFCSKFDRVTNYWSFIHLPMLKLLENSHILLFHGGEDLIRDGESSNISQYLDFVWIDNDYVMFVGQLWSFMNYVPAPIST